MRILPLAFILASASAGNYEDYGPAVAAIWDSDEKPLPPSKDTWSVSCVSLYPENSTVPAQTTPCPFKLTLNRNSTPADRAVALTVKAPRPLTFKGLMVQARDDRTGEVAGEFDSYYTEVMFINCFDRPYNTAVQRDLSPKTRLVLRWLPEYNEDTTVTFYVTIAQEISPSPIYWAYQKVGTVDVTRDPSIRPPPGYNRANNF